MKWCVQLTVVSMLVVATHMFPAAVEPQLLVPSLHVAQDAGMQANIQAQHPDPLENIGVELESGILIEGDVRYTMAPPLEHMEWGAMGAARGYAADTNSHQVRNSVGTIEQIWPNKIIPYVLDITLNETEIYRILKAMHTIMNGSDSCVEFVVRSTEPDYLYITQQRTGCWSDVGRKGGNQTVSVSRGSDCVTTGIVMHELMHALGFWHEHTRRDREQYITILTDNIRYDHRSDFNMNHNGKILIPDYDYYSIMHYKTTTFSIDSSRLKTIQILNGNINESLVGQREHLTNYDNDRIKKLYSCDKSRRNPESFSDPASVGRTTGTTSERGGSRDAAATSTTQSEPGTSSPTSASTSTTQAADHVADTTTLEDHGLFLF